MKKVKVKKEYFIDLLNKKKGSVREEREEPGFTLLDESPEWATEKNLWTEGTYEGTYNKKIEGWEKLCIEAYLCGWIDYFDIQVAKVPDEGEGARTIYFNWEEEDKKDKLALKVYLDPNGPKPDPPPPPPSSRTNVPKPPPPPIS